MEVVFFIITVLTLAGAIAAMSLRHLVHCALCLAVAFGGLAAFYLQLNAQFIGFAQILVYIGAVAVLIVFAILLTRGIESAPQPLFSSAWPVGLGVALLVFGSLVFAIQSSSVAQQQAAPSAQATIRTIGSQLMTNFVLPLELIALLLTAALIGAVIIAMQEPSAKSTPMKDHAASAPIPSVPEEQR
ncbi:MAG: NADH-quinone oxidoreductase subunit J [Verrucomicrobia bacterium]|nr:NADH-quinone oxidoreductase subunit J [Verrucomicrobiota bacterium]